MIVEYFLNNYSKTPRNRGVILFYDKWDARILVKRLNKTMDGFLFSRQATPSEIETSKRNKRMYSIIYDSFNGLMQDDERCGVIHTPENIQKLKIAFERLAITKGN